MCGASRSGANRRGFARCGVARRRAIAGVEKAAARIDTAAPRTGIPHANLFRFAVAAVIALTLIGLGWQTLMLRGRLATEDLALVTMVHSHFNHVSMAPESANPVAAKILYARDGAWIYIIADKPGASLHAIASTATGTTDLGVLASAGETATLLFRPRDRIRSIILRRGGTTVASATLTY